MPTNDGEVKKALLSRKLLQSGGENKQRAFVCSFVDLKILRAQKRSTIRFA